MYGECQIKQFVGTGSSTWQYMFDENRSYLYLVNSKKTVKIRKKIRTPMTKCRIINCGGLNPLKIGDECSNDQDCQSCWCKPSVGWPDASGCGTCQSRFKNPDEIISYCSIPLCNDPAQSEAAQLPMYTKASSVYYNYSKLLKNKDKHFPNTLSDLRKNTPKSPALKSDLMVGHPSTAFGMAGGNILRKDTSKVWGTSEQIQRLYSH